MIVIGRQRKKTCWVGWKGELHLGCCIFIHVTCMWSRMQILNSYKLHLKILLDATQYNT